jgi:hypothetical protein
MDTRAGIDVVIWIAIELKMDRNEWIARGMCDCDASDKRWERKTRAVDAG